MKHTKKRIGQRVLSVVLASCLILSSLAPGMAGISYADNPDQPAQPVVTEGDAVQTEIPQDFNSEKVENVENPDVPTIAPEETLAPTAEPIAEPSAEPTAKPSADPTATPTAEPSPEPTPEATKEPNVEDFTALTVLNPENGETVVAKVGDEVTLTAGLNRNDVAVSYQWQRMQLPIPEKEQAPVSAIYDYTQGAPTWYSFPLEDKTEAQILEQNPDATWPGIELYQAAVQAILDIGADASSVSFAWKTPNFALDGYTILAKEEDGTLTLTAEKDDTVYTATRNSENKFTFGDAASAAITENVWQDIEGANDAAFSFTVKEEDLYATYRLKVTITDETYLKQCIALLEQQNVTLTEEEKASQQILYSVVMQVTSPDAPAEEVPEPEERKGFAASLFSFFSANPEPYLSEDGQWICGLNGSYQYITEDTFNRVKNWVTSGKLDSKTANNYWTNLGKNGFESTNIANVLDENGFATGQTRTYNGFDLVDGHKLEVASEWYGKTVLFRQHGSKDITRIKIPAYTELKNGENGYEEAASGTKYKKAITFLNPFVIDTGPMYRDFLKVTSANGWLLETLPNGDITNNKTDNHISVYPINVEAFNRDPQRYLVDAEGNYRMDSVGWGVCTSEEPDLSGKAYWTLKDYIANGYGFLTGHDTMYAYAGAYYDALGTDLDESTIDPNDGTTWYYDINSWQPGTTATSYTRDPNDIHHITGIAGTSATRGGHFYMNQLMGTNKGNILSGNVLPSDSPSLILSSGGSHGTHGKNIMYGSKQLEILQNGYAAELAKENPRYRTPTNYPYAFTEGQIISSSFTHSNGQIAFGPIWANYYGMNQGHLDYGYDKDPLHVTIGEKVGTNNFYLTGQGNYLMNQIGHLPQNSATNYESILLSNSVMYVSQRKQCEICAANQNGQQTSHFVRRVSAANVNEVLTALQNGGNYWYPLDGCYQLTEDITLPEDWNPIKGFRGHWNSDVYTVTLNSKNAPLLANDKHDGEKGWNLGTDKSKGVQTVFNGNMVRTTGVARVVGDLNDLFSTQSVNYAGYTVKFLGSDNPKYMTAKEEYSCTVNTDSKYVVSNLPCVFQPSSKTGVLRARVYDTNGSEVTQYGVIRADVPETFWNTDMTTPLYLGAFKADPVPDASSYESADAKLYGVTVVSDEPTVVGWQYRETEKDAWKSVPADWGTVSAPSITKLDTGDYRCLTTLNLSDINPTWDGYEFRAVFSSTNHGTWSTYDYYLNGSTASLEDNGGVYKKVAVPHFSGKLTVDRWPARTAQSSDKKVFEGDTATFASQIFVLDADGVIDAKWQYSTKEWNALTGNYDLVWHDVAGSADYGHAQITQNTTLCTDAADAASGWNMVESALPLVASGTDVNQFKQNARFWQVDTSLSIDKIDIQQTDTHFRVVYAAQSKYGTSYDIFSNDADEQNWKWTGYSTDALEKLDLFNEQPLEKHSNVLTVDPPALNVEMQEANKFSDSALNLDVNDQIGQMLLLPNVDAQIADGKAVYRAFVYYLPERNKPDISWQYRSFTDSKAKDWNQDAANALGYTDAVVDIHNTDRGTTEIDGITYNVIESVMTIDNAPLSMYNTETSTKYFFRCLANTSYETIKEQKSITKVDSRSGYQWGGLTMDYAISIHHNGVLGYGGHNGVEAYGGGHYQVTDSLEELVDIINHIPSEYVAWYYPDLEVKVPAGHHVNTVVVWFDDNYTHSSGDAIWFNANRMHELGIECAERTTQKVVFVSQRMNAVETSTWNQFLSNHVAFATNDTIDYQNAGKDGVKGGARIKWYADENRLSGIQIDTKNNKAYVLKTTSDEISWEAAKRAAEQWNSDLGLNGHLVQIDSAEENEIVRNLLNGSPAWTGGIWNWDRHEYIWTHSGNRISYSNWAPGEPASGRDNIYVTIRPDGKWESIAGTTNVSKNYHLSNQGQGFERFFLGNCHVGSYAKIPVSLKHGHKYYVLTQWGDFGDTNAGGHIEISAFGINVHNNWNSNYNEWLTGIDDIYTFNHEDDIWNVYYYCDEMGTDVSGNYCVLYGLNVIDLTDTFGAGNEPSLREIRQMVYGDSRSVGYVGNKEVTYHYSHTADIHNYVVEYDLDSLGMVVTNHSASDSDYIGTRGSVPDLGNKEVSVSITGNEKVYDKQEISPSSFVVTGDKGASNNLFEITYTLLSGPHSGYTTTTVRGNDWQHTGAVNAGLYHAEVSLTDAAIADGWTISQKDSILYCDLKISARPVDAYSADNNKVYDGHSNGTIQNIMLETASNGRGVVDGDIVNLNTTTATGQYTSNGIKKETHNSVTNSPTGIWKLHRDKDSELYVAHDDVSDPHHNYFLDRENYTGAITQKGLYVHSLYLEDSNNPRNVKSYDGTDAAEIRNIIIDGIVPGDNISLVNWNLSGYYSTANAGETLTEDGKVQPDRLKKLVENPITASENAELSGDKFNDYFIEREEYSGAITRAPLIGKIKGWIGRYGDGMKEQPWADSSYTATSTSSSWLQLTGLVAKDTLELTSNSSFDYDLLPDSTTAVGDYPLTYTGLNEANYPVLSNYVVSIEDGLLRVTPRPILVKPDDFERVTKSSWQPVHASFSMQENDVTWRELGSDSNTDYAAMPLIGDDTIFSVVRVITPDGTTEVLHVSDEGTSNIGYDTECTVDSPARYLNTEDALDVSHSNPHNNDCAFCENYFGFKYGTAHPELAGYPIAINQDAAAGNILTIASVQNFYGEDVENYELVYQTGTITVHPWARIQLEATVPLQVCMHGNGGDGTVIEPTNYGITNYSNCNVHITDINVEGPWQIKDMPDIETMDDDDASISLYHLKNNKLAAGEMYLRLQHTVLQSGHTETARQTPWIIPQDDITLHKGVYRSIPITSYIACGGLNSAAEHPVVHVTYTVDVYLEKP